MLHYRPCHMYLWEQFFISVLNRNLLTATKQMCEDLTKAKKPRLAMNIGTHNGTFHCDEVLACFLLKQLPEYADAEIIR